MIVRTSARGLDHAVLARLGLGLGHSATAAPPGSRSEAPPIGSSRGAAGALGVRGRGRPRATHDSFRPAREAGGAGRARGIPGPPLPTRSPLPRLPQLLLLSGHLENKLALLLEQLGRFGAVRSEVRAPLLKLVAQTRELALRLVSANANGLELAVPGLCRLARETGRRGLLFRRRRRLRELHLGSRGRRPQRGVFGAQNL